MHLGVVVLIKATLTATLTVQYHDCQEPEKIEVYQKNHMCRPEDQTKQRLDTFAILQTRNTQEVEGYSCSIVRSTMNIYCGAYSHSKLAGIPDIGFPEPISTENCREMINSQKLTTQDGQTHDI